MRRRTFCAKVGGLALLGMIFSRFAGCGKASPNGPSGQKADIKLGKNLKGNLSAVHNSLTQLRGMDGKPGKKLWIEAGDSAKIFSAEFVTGSLSPALRLTDSAGEFADLSWTLKAGIIPTLKIATSEGKSAEVPVTAGLAKATFATADELIALGVKITAAALVVWLGSSLIAAILGALAYLAFIALAIGLIFVATGFAEKFLGGFGWQDFENFFRKALDDIVRVIQRALS